MNKEHSWLIQDDLNFHSTLSNIDINIRYQYLILLQEVMMIRNVELAFIRIHILYHASKEAVFGMGLMEELARHGYSVGPGLIYPLLARMEKEKVLSCRKKIVRHKQRKYYTITPAGISLLEQLKEKIKKLYEEVIES